MHLIFWAWRLRCPPRQRVGWFLSFNLRLRKCQGHHIHSLLDGRSFSSICAVWAEWLSQHGRFWYPLEVEEGGGDQ